MAAFDDIGAKCSEPTCGRQDFLPFRCDACARNFCEEHFRHADHGCEAAAGKDKQVVLCPQCNVALPLTGKGDPLEGHTCAVCVPAKGQLRCAAPGCREVLSSHNKVNCWRCRKDVCIRHRFEEDHPCVSVDVAVKTALRWAREEMGPEEFLEAQKTLVKVFGNIVAEPGNEKFRTLKKANAVVQEKLRHPACKEALRLSGFEDTGEAFVCRTTADLSVMRQMATSLKAYTPDRGSASLAPSSAPSSGSSAGGGSGTRLVNGIITRVPASAAPTPMATPPKPVPVASAKAVPAPGNPGGATGGYRGGAKPKSAFDFERRSKAEERLQSQETQLSEARKLQKERYKTGANQNVASSTSASGAPRTDTAAAGSNGAEEQQCEVQ